MFTKPNPSSPMTIKVNPPSLRQKLGMKVVCKFLEKLRKGSLVMTLPDKSKRIFGNTESGIAASINVNNYAFFWKVLKSGDIGFGESYMDGDWDTENLTDVLKVFIENMDQMSDREITWSKIGRGFNRLLHLRRKNTPTGSRDNIGAHYDLSNDFFATFLDPTMFYSCGIYNTPDDTLEQAQKNKVESIIRKARITQSDHVLEIGSGWGGFAIEAARQTGCKVTTITLSQEQLKLVRERIKEAGLENQVNVELIDYRHVQGQYDKIVSIEMLEAVGAEYFGEFFRTCDRLLKPDGLVVIQVITIPDQRYEDYRRGTDWIQKYIFPGGILPSLTALCNAMTSHSQFFLESVENIGFHYANTLREWRARFLASREKVSGLGFDEKFIRTWLYYLSYCEAGFASRILNDLHLVLTRPNNKKL